MIIECEDKIILVDREKCFDYEDGDCKGMTVTVKRKRRSMSTPNLRKGGCPYISYFFTAQDSASHGQ